MSQRLVPLIVSAFLSTTVVGHAEEATDYARTGESADGVIAGQSRGTVNLTGGSVAAGIGFSWGHGKLTISGVSLVDVGAVNFSASGQVYNLTNLADFNGNYVAVAAGITLAGGGSATYLKNEHGVVIRLHSTDVGLKFNLSADGVKVTLAG